LVAPLFLGRREPRPRRTLIIVLAIAGLLGAAQVTTFSTAPSAEASTVEDIVAWYEADDADCQSLAVFSSDATSPADIRLVVDCGTDVPDGGGAPVSRNALGITWVGHPSWSPDGSQIAFVGQNGDGYLAFVVDVDGSGLRELCIDFDCSESNNRLRNVWTISWGGDDHLYASNAPVAPGTVGLVRMSMDDGSGTRIEWDTDDQPYAWNPALSPDGSLLAYHDYDDVYVAPVGDLSDWTALTSASGDVRHTTWDATGTRVVYVDRAWPMLDENENVVLRNAIVARSVSVPDDVVPLVADLSLTPRSPAMSPDGSRMIFLDNGTRDVFVIDLASEGPEGPFVPLFAFGDIGGRMAAFDWYGSGAARQSASPTVSLSCAPLPPPVGVTVTCTVAGADPGIDILWRASYNPVFASAGVAIGSDGTGTFSFVVPVAARGSEVMVELVEWVAPQSLGVAGSIVPTSIPAGEGPRSPSGPMLLVVAAALLLVSRFARRRASAARN
jgi:hypothetical protein